MSPRRSYDLLPETIRTEANAKLIGSAFGNIDEVTTWLKQQGFEISRSAVGRANRKLKEQFNAAFQDALVTTEMAKAMVASNEDERGAVMEASERIAADGLLRLQFAMRDIDFDNLSEDEDKNGLLLAMAKAMPNITRAIADLNRSGVARAKWKSIVDEKLNAAAQKSEAIAKKAGLSDEDWAKIRANFLGVGIG